MNINYALIGSIPSVEAQRDNLPALIAAFQKEQRTDQLYKQLVTIVDCAAHFYGISALDFNTPATLIEAIRAADQELEFK